MPKPLRISRRTSVAAWAVLCAAGVAATAALNASPAPDPQSEKRGRPVSAECAEYIADVERQLAKAEEEGDEDGALAFVRTRTGTDDCSDEIRDHFSGDRSAATKPEPTPSRVYSSCLAADTKPTLTGDAPCDGR
ncbi:hypothetical protein [Streptomyces sp. 13-12-16]|uniref:hypothetical protein n=1 Tax=Streptomyces sp. 13-12-16 TaxID=1570823 RepID=UPI00211A5753|nr:hypothetical protein [Streptomyces sp. 13-12-16]